MVIYLLRNNPHLGTPNIDCVPYLHILQVLCHFTTVRKLGVNSSKVYLRKCNRCLIIQLHNYLIINRVIVTRVRIYACNYDL